jgi:hypothetical protein
MDSTEITGQKLDYTKESIKLTRNSKGYTWEIKLIPAEGFILLSSDFGRLKEYDDRIAKQYGDLK